MPLAPGLYSTMTGRPCVCDIFYASESATFGMPEINVGLAGGASMLRALFGRSTTRRLFFTGQRLSAAELKARWIIEDVTTPEALIPTAMEIAQEIAQKAPMAIACAKQAANMVENMPQRDASRHEQNYTMALSRTEDAHEARMAFAEKRAPVFKGCRDGNGGKRRARWTKCSRRARSRSWGRRPSRRKPEGARSRC